MHRCPSLRDLLLCSQEFLLDNFMNGFIYKQYLTKWDIFVGRVFKCRLVVIAVYVLFVTLLAAPSILPIQVPMPADGHSAVDGSFDSPTVVGDLGTHPMVLIIELVFASLITALELWEMWLSVRPDEDELNADELTAPDKTKRRLPDRADVMAKVRSLCCSDGGRVRQGSG